MDSRRLRWLRSFVPIVVVIFVLCFVINTFLFLCYYTDKNQPDESAAIENVDNEEESSEKEEHIGTIIEQNIAHHKIVSQHNPAISHSKLSFDDLKNRVGFNIRGNDVIVFLHIQKTGEVFF